MIRETLTLLLAVTALTLPTRSLAECVCPPKPGVEKAFETADFCFTGRVKSIKKSVLREGEYEISFAVTKQYKGFDELGISAPPSEADAPPRETALIVYNKGESDPCSYPFYDGQDYLVFASGSPAHLTSDMCSNTDLEDSARRAVAKLNEIVETQKKNDAGSQEDSGKSVVAD